MVDNEEVWVPALRSSVKNAAPRPGHSAHAASAFSTSLTQYDVPNTIASSLKL
jgi:hypothetical protein